MTVEECTAILTTAALAMRADIDAPTFRAYHRILKAVEAPLLEAAIDQVLGEGARFFPSAPELLIACEKQRRAMLALRPWTPCVECECSPGYRQVAGIEGAQPTVEKCPCKARHRAWLAEYGLATPLASLPTEAGAGDEAVYPTVDQLPESVRKPLLEMAGRKVLR